MTTVCMHEQVPCTCSYSLCVKTCLEESELEKNKRMRNINVRFPAVTPWLVLQWPCLCECVCVLMCVCVCGGSVCLLSHSLVFSRFSELCGVNAEITC